MLEIFLPYPASVAATQIDPASAIVGVRQDDNVLVYFESNRYGATNLVRWSDRVECAAGRLLAKYPTVAMAVLPAAELRSVGSFYPSTGRLQFHSTDDAVDVARWCGEETERLMLTSRAEHREATEAALLKMAGGSASLAAQLARQIGVRL